jgi:hypothetical protein
MPDRLFVDRSPFQNELFYETRHYTKMEGFFFRRITKTLGSYLTLSLNLYDSHFFGSKSARVRIRQKLNRDPDTDHHLSKISKIRSAHAPICWPCT